jgi:HJR/Mrr/RecB family endonuclease
MDMNDNGRAIMICLIENKGEATTSYIREYINDKSNLPNINLDKINYQVNARLNNGENSNASGLELVKTQKVATNKSKLVVLRDCVLDNTVEYLSILKDQLNRSRGKLDNPYDGSKQSQSVEISDNNQLADIYNTLDPDEFERFIGFIWNDLGWESRIVDTDGCGDNGIDVIARQKTPVNITSVIQVKLVRDNIGSKTVRACAGLHSYDDCDTSILVTLSGYTSAAEQTAEEMNVKIINGYDLLDIIAKTENTVEDYIERSKGGDIL